MKFVWMSFYDKIVFVLLNANDVVWILINYDIIFINSAGRFALRIRKYSFIYNKILLK